MNKEQIGAILRTILQSIAAGLVAKGVIVADQTAPFVEIGAALILWVGVTAWGVLARSNKNLVRAAERVKREEGPRPPLATEVLGP